MLLALEEVVEAPAMDVRFRQDLMDAGSMVAMGVEELAGRGDHRLSGTELFGRDTSRMGLHGFLRWGLAEKLLHRTRR